MLVPRERSTTRRSPIAKAAAEAHKVGDPQAPRHACSVRSSAQVQFDKIQGLIETGIDEGATLVTGGPGRPDGLNRGYYVRPTVFGDVTPDMTIAREEIFGPVLSILPYDDEEQAVEIANDTVYGLAAYVQSENSSTRARSPAGCAPARSTSTIRTGTPSRRSAATSSPATAASTPTGRSTTSWR